MFALVKYHRRLELNCLSHIFEQNTNIRRQIQASDSVRHEQQPLCATNGNAWLLCTCGGGLLDPSSFFIRARAPCFYEALSFLHHVKIEYSKAKKSHM